MVKAAVIGASGYAGAELCRILSGHPDCELTGVFVSSKSEDLGKRVSDLYGSFYGICDLVLQAVPDAASLADIADCVFLATDHRVSHDLAPLLIEHGVKVFDLSGAFRIQDLDVFAKAYGFAHEHEALLREAVYALPEHTDHEQIRAARLLSLPGCYPTASQTALNPLIDGQLLDLSYRPVIDAVSGVSGAGRKAKLASSFCEVSMNAYGVFTHRHQPEIAEHLGTQVIFSPHLGPFKRGILATITARLRAGVGKAEVSAAYEKAYAHTPCVRFKHSLPYLSDVQGTPFCDVGFCVSDDGYIIAVAAIDNLLKGASAQAVQVFNIANGFDECSGLL